MSYRRGSYYEVVDAGRVDRYCVYDVCDLTSDLVM